MRKVLYAHGVSIAEDEELIAQDEERDEKFLNKVVADIRWAEGFYKDRDLEFERQERWYFRDHYERPQPDTGDIPPGQRREDTGSNIDDEHLVTINMPFSSIQRAHMLMTSESPNIEILATGRDSTRAERVSQFCLGAMFVNTKRWGSNPMHDAIFNQLLYGWGVVRSIWQRNEFEDPNPDFKGDRPAHDFPIEISSVHPREVYPIPGGVVERWKAVIQKTRMRVYEVEDAYGVTLHMNDNDAMDSDDPETFDYTEPLDPQKEVEVLDYWCWEGNLIVHGVIAHEQFVVRPVKMTYYDKLPYTIFFCAGTTGRLGDQFGLSANYALVDSVAEMEWLANRQMRLIDMYAEPVTIVKKVNDDGIEVVPGETVEIVEGEEVRYLQYQGTLPDITLMSNFFRELADDEGFTLPRDVSDSGLETIAQQQASLIKIFKPVENAEAAWEEVNYKVIGLLQRFSWDERVQGVGRTENDEESEAFSFAIRGRDTRNFRETKVTLRAKFPLEELRHVAMAATLKNSRLMPAKVIMKRFLGATNAELWRDLILDEVLEEDPQLIGAVLQDNLALIAQNSQMASQVQQELDAMAQRGEPSGAGTPEAPAPLNVGPGLLQQSADVEGNVAAGGMEDNPTPTSTAENPLANLTLGGRTLF